MRIFFLYWNKLALKNLIFWFVILEQKYLPKYEFTKIDFIKDVFLGKKKVNFLF